MQSHHQLAWKARSIGLATALCICLLGVLGCGDVSHMFGGMWKSETALSASFIDGRPELAIGHFGREMTGIVRFLDEDGIVAVPDCGCAYLDQQDIDLDSQRFVASTTLCNNEPVILIWELTLDEEAADPRLVGEVRPANDDVTTPVAVSFRLEDRFVPDDKHDECKP